MEKTQQKESFSYWKRPYQKWIVLAAAVFQLVALAMNLKDLGEIAGSGALSDSERELYLIEKSLQCAIFAMTTLLFFGGFLIGCFVKSHRAARTAEGGMLVCLTLAWGVAGGVLHLATAEESQMLWGFILVLAIGGSIYSFWKARNP